jgi:hypothetical protein
LTADREKEKNTENKEIFFHFDVDKDDNVKEIKVNYNTNVSNEKTDHEKMNEENFHNKKEIYDSSNIEKKEGKFIGHRLTFQKKFEEIFPIHIESVHSESEMTQEVLSDFNSVGMIVRYKILF